MIHAEFRKLNGNYSGFEISGHAGYAGKGEDVVCAAVSSAVQLTVNLLAEFGCAPEVSAKDSVRCRVTCELQTGSRIVSRLAEHLTAVLEEFPETINITISEV